MPAALLPARHLELTGSNPTQSEKLRATQRGCRRDIRSNGWIELWKAPRADRSRSGRRNKLSSFGADRLKSAISPATSWSVGSGPDVFADALVPARGKHSPALQFPNGIVFRYRRPCPRPYDRARSRPPLRPWLSVCETRTVNRLLAGLPTSSSIIAFSIPRAGAHRARLHAIHRDG